MRPNSISAEADTTDEASYIERLPLASYGNWGGVMRELHQKLSNFSPEEPQTGDVAAVRSGREDLNDYTEEFGRAGLVEMINF
ncbi:hypothetical protein BDV10DRAFT_181316 [Aspergillus recurvatus]